MRPKIEVWKEVYCNNESKLLADKIPRSLWLKSIDVIRSGMQLNDILPFRTWTLSLFCKLSRGLGSFWIGFFSFNCRLVTIRIVSIAERDILLNGFNALQGKPLIVCEENNGETSFSRAALLLMSTGDDSLKLPVKIKLQILSFLLPPSANVARSIENGNDLKELIEY